MAQRQSQMPIRGVGVGMKRGFEQIQQKARSNIRQQEQVAGYSIDGSLKLMNHESFDKLSQRRLNQQI